MSEFQKFESGDLRVGAKVQGQEDALITIIDIWTNLDGRLNPSTWIEYTYTLPNAKTGTEKNVIGNFIQNILK